jgi:hypothetical protein
MIHTCECKGLALFSSGNPYDIDDRGHRRNNI